jgi:hypothetical protein
MSHRILTESILRTVCALSFFSTSGVRQFNNQLVKKKRYEFRVKLGIFLIQACMTEAVVPFYYYYLHTKGLNNQARHLIGMHVNQIFANTSSWSSHN